LLFSSPTAHQNCPSCSSHSNEAFSSDHIQTVPPSTHDPDPKHFHTEVSGVATPFLFLPFNFSLDLLCVTIKEYLSLGILFKKKKKKNISSHLWSLRD
jgi:hypothetical protein